MSLARRAARAAFDRSGAIHLLRLAHRSRLRILMYHRFWPESAELESLLDAQCRHLRQHYQVISMSAVDRCLTSGDPFPPNAVVLTVDDGHRDFYTRAFPVLRRWGLTATLNVTTDYIDGRQWLWFDLADYLFATSSRERVEVELLGGPRILDTPERCSIAAREFKEKAAGLGDNAMRAALATLPAELGVDPPARPPEQWAPFTWDEAREMCAAGMEIGAHTRTHPILARVGDPGAIREEIAGSKRRVEEMLGREAPHFCYPNGRREDVTDAVIDEVRHAGFRTAVLSEPGLNDRHSAPLLLQRVGMEPDSDPAYFRRKLAGFGLK